MVGNLAIKFIKGVGNIHKPIEMSKAVMHFFIDLVDQTDHDIAYKRPKFFKSMLIQEYTLFLVVTMVTLREPPD